MKTSRWLLVIVLCYTGVAAQEPSVPLKGYTLFWHDEFNGHQLDPSKWQYHAPGKRRQAYNTPSSIYLDGKGNLVIMAQLKGDSVLAGIIDTDNRLNTTYGYFECRAKLTSANGIWPGFWLMSRTNHDHSKPETHGAEIDIFEYFSHAKKDSVAHSLHWGGYGKTHQVAGPVWGALGKGDNGYHTFGLEWTPNSYTVYVDGKKTHRIDRLISHVPEFVLLSVEVDASVAGPLNKAALPDKFIVDYIRVYKKQ
jgi:beta-glucanase (GH16 family)